MSTPVFETISEVPQETKYSLWSLLNSLKNVLQVVVECFTSSDNEWKTPYLLNDWQRYSTGYPSARYRKDGMGNVYLGGMVKGGTPGSTSVICELPDGFRPDAKLQFVTASADAPTNASRLSITIEGEVVAVTGSTTWYSLDNISFKAV
jgi:hypothetical protein